MTTLVELSKSGGKEVARKKQSLEEAKPGLVKMYAVVRQFIDEVPKPGFPLAFSAFDLRIYKEVQAKYRREAKEFPENRNSLVLSDGTIGDSLDRYTFGLISPLTDKDFSLIK